MLNIVYAPPFSEKKLNRIAGLWDEMPALLTGVNATISYPRPGTIPTSRYFIENIPEAKGMFAWASEKFEKDYIAKKKPNSIIRSVLEKRLTKLYKRPIYSKPIHKYHLNGCCIPGGRKIFVSTRGNFHVCERISSTAPPLGNVFSGIDMDTIKKIYIDDYNQKSTFCCSECWAIQLCGICYNQAFYNGKYDYYVKNKHCSSERAALEKTLILYCSLLEKDQHGLDYLDNMVLG